VPGVGQLLDQQNITFPATATLPVRTELEPGTYVGSKYAIGGGTTADPIAPGTSRTYHIAMTNTGNTTETMAQRRGGSGEPADVAEVLATLLGYAKGLGFAGRTRRRRGPPLRGGPGRERGGVIINLTYPRAS
jgi:hypothetical protein